MRPLTAILAAAFCVVAPVAVTAQPEQPVMLSQLLKAPLLGAPTRPTVGEQQPEIASVDDLLVGDDGHTEVIVMAEDEEPAGRIIPWSELIYNGIRNKFTLRTQGDDLGRFPPWHEPVSDTHGTASKILASKLLNGLVQTPSGERLGEVVDLRVGKDGVIKQIFLRRDQKTTTIPWKGVDVQSERPDISASPDAEAVIVVDRKKL